MRQASGTRHIALAAPANDESLVTTAAEAIRAIVLRGDLPPGFHIVENTLAQRFDVSQGTIRAALRVLVHEGLLEIRPRRGCFVRQFTSRDVTEIYTLRNALESLAAREAAVAMSKVDRRRLTKCMGAIAATIAARDMMGFIEADFAFHRVILAGSRHARLQAVYGGLASQTRLFMLSAAGDLSSTFLDDMHALHESLAEAIVAGDADGAGRLAATHNNGTGRALAASLARRERDMPVHPAPVAGLLPDTRARRPSRAIR